MKQKNEESAQEAGKGYPLVEKKNSKNYNWLIPFIFIVVSIAIYLILT